MVFRLGGLSFVVDQAAPHNIAAVRLRHSIVLWTPMASTRLFVTTSTPERRKIAKMQTSTTKRDAIRRRRKPTSRPARYRRHQGKGAGGWHCSGRRSRHPGLRLRFGGGEAPQRFLLYTFAASSSWSASAPPDAHCIAQGPFTDASLRKNRHQNRRFVRTPSSRRQNSVLQSFQVSNTPALLNRSKRFQMLFQLPNRFGSARQEMLWTEK